MECALCKKQMEPWLKMPIDPKKKAFTEGSSSFEFCSTCSLGSMAPIPDAKVISKFYDLDVYYTQSEGHMEHVRSGFLDRVLTKVSYLLDNGEDITPDFFLNKIPEGADVLDVGAGGGGKLTKYQSFGWKTYGLEPDPDAIAHSLPSPITTYQGTAEQVPEQLRKISFDFISMTHVLEHCQNPVYAIDNIFKLLKPGGKFWCEVPNSGCKHFTRFNICSEMFDAPRHIHFFDDKSLVKIMEQSGFIVEQLYFNGFCRHHSPSWRNWEVSIYNKLKEEAPEINARKHSYWQSVRLLLSNIVSKPKEKYDCIGVIVKRPE